MIANVNALKFFCRCLVAVTAFGQCTNAAVQSSPMETVLEAIEHRRKIANGISVSCERVQNNPEGIYRETSIWKIQPSAARFRQEQTVYQSATTSPGEQQEVRTVVAFDGERGVVWHPEDFTGPEDAPLLNVSKMSPDKSFLRGRVTGPVFWWLGIFDDFDAVSTKRISNLAGSSWRRTDDGNIMCVVRHHDTERRYHFSPHVGFNVVEAEHGIRRNGKLFITAHTVVTYKKVDASFVPTAFVRDYPRSGKTDVTEVKSWEFIDELAISEARLPAEFLKPGMLVSDDQVKGGPRIVSSVGTLIPRPRYGTPYTSNPLRGPYWFIIVVGVVVTLVAVVRIRKGAT